MKTLDSQALHSGIDELMKKINTQINQLKKLENVIEVFLSLNHSFNGIGVKQYAPFTKIGMYLSYLLSLYVKKL